MEWSWRAFPKYLYWIKQGPLVLHQLAYHPFEPEARSMLWPLSDQFNTVHIGRIQ